ncbi:hypothetical protein KCMC57_up12540 [Kitasatospora sp. CMC57]|uniref:Uncharacterized protein n=1 Tax=Kitasatospora sp. CMC57 TaxID=3231513 RepID=A0AB33JPP8_9ACTN
MAESARRVQRRPSAAPTQAITYEMAGVGQPKLKWSKCPIGPPNDSGRCQSPVRCGFRIRRTLPSDHKRLREDVKSSPLGGSNMLNWSGRCAPGALGGHGGGPGLQHHAGGSTAFGFKGSWTDGNGRPRAFT